MCVVRCVCSGDGNTHCSDGLSCADVLVAKRGCAVDGENIACYSVVCICDTCGGGAVVDLVCCSDGDSK